MIGLTSGYNVRDIRYEILDYDIRMVRLTFQTEGKTLSPRALLKIEKIGTLWNYTNK